MGFLLVLLLVFNGLSAISLLVQWIGLRCARISDESVTLFFGPTVTSFSLLGTPISIGCIPTGGSIKFDMEDFKSRSLGLRIALRLSGLAVLFLISAILLGFDAASHHTVAGSAQLIFGALHPRDVGVALIDRLWEISRAAPQIFIGVVATKMVTISLFPVGPSTMTQCLLEFSDREKLGKGLEIYAVISALALYLFYGAWLVAAILFAARSSAP